MKKLNSSFVSDQTNDVVERGSAWRRQSDKVARTGRGPKERGEGHAEPVDNRRVLRSVLDASVHDQLRAGVLRRVFRAVIVAQHVHHPVTP